MKSPTPSPPDPAVLALVALAAAVETVAAALRPVLAHGLALLLALAGYRPSLRATAEPPAKTPRATTELPPSSPQARQPRAAKTAAPTRRRRTTIPA